MWRPTCNPYRSLDDEAEGYAVRRGSPYPATRVSVLLVEARSVWSRLPTETTKKKEKEGKQQFWTDTFILPGLTSVEDDVGDEVEHESYHQTKAEDSDENLVTPPKRRNTGGSGRGHGRGGRGGKRYKGGRASKLGSSRG